MAKKKPVEPQVPDDEVALVQRYDRRIKAALKNSEDRFKRFETHRKYYRGIAHKDGATGLVRTNLIFATIASIYPQIYAKNPDISISPAESVSEETYDQTKLFGKTSEIVMNRLLVKGGKLKKRIKSQIRATMTCDVGWLKVTWQKDTKTDPVIKNRMDDIQDNINRLEAAAQALEEAEGDPDVTVALLKQQLEALRPDLEKVISSGIVIDKIQTEHLLILDPQVQDFDDYLNAGAMCQLIYMSADKFAETFGRSHTEKAKTWNSTTLPKQNGDTTAATKGEQDEEFVCVREIWAKEANTIYTHCEGEEGWCRGPFQPDRLGERWYPFFGLCFNPVDGEAHGISDVELLIELQEEYSGTRTALTEHRKYNKPIRVVRSGGGLTPDDVENLKKADYGDTVVVGGDSSTPLQNDVTILQGAPMDPAMYDVTVIRADIEMVTGASDATQGSVLKAKTATEAEIMRQGLAGRTGERQDIIEDMIQEIGIYGLQMAIHELSVPEVAKMVGPKAAWPAEPSPDALDMLRFEIRAGSTGKPDKNQEREQWTQLLPLLQQAMEKVMLLRQSGQNDMADAVVELTRESLRRFDERIDIDSFLPRKKEGEIDPQQMQMQLQQKDAEMQQVSQVAQQLMQQVQELTAQLNDKQAERQHAVEVESAKGLSAERVAQTAANAKAMEGALAEAIAQTKRVTSRLDAVERAVGSIPAPAEPIDKNEILLEVRDLIDKLAPKVETQPQQAPPLEITVPVTVQMPSGAVKKTMKIKPGPDGSYIGEAIEAPTEGGE